MAKYSPPLSPVEHAELPVLDLDDFVPYQLARAAEVVSQKFAKVYGDRYGLTRPEWRTLATLGQYGTLTATQIGGHSSMHKTMVSRAVLSLEQRHWLRRESDFADRRVEHLSLTSNGSTAYKDLVVAAQAYEESLSSLLGMKISALKSALNIISAKLG